MIEIIKLYGMVSLVVTCRLVVMVKRAGWIVKQNGGTMLNDSMFGSGMVIANGSVIDSGLLSYACMVGTILILCGYVVRPMPRLPVLT